MEIENLGKIDKLRPDWEESKNFGLSRKVLSLSDLEAKEKEGWHFICPVFDGVKVVWFFRR